MHTIHNADTGMTHTKPLIADVPSSPGLTCRPPPIPIRSNVPLNQESSPSSPSVETVNPNINLDFAEISPFQEGVISETFQRLDKSFFQARYLTSSHFKNIYLYLSQNKLPTFKTAIKKIETLAERYILLDSLLFKITPEKESAVLAVSETCIDKIITLYHSSLFAGHQGVIKTYLTISNKFLFQTSYIMLGPI